MGLGKGCACHDVINSRPAAGMPAVKGREESWGIKTVAGAAAAASGRGVMPGISRWLVAICGPADRKREREPPAG